jgi:hypothetical protein
MEHPHSMHVYNRRIGSEQLLDELRRKTISTWPPSRGRYHVNTAPAGSPLFIKEIDAIPFEKFIAKSENRDINISSRTQALD